MNDKTILTLHPLTDIAVKVLEDPRNAILVIREHITHIDKAITHNRSSTLSLT